MFLPNVSFCWTFCYLISIILLSFIILYLSFYYLLTLFSQISEKWLWHFWNTFVKCDTFVTHLWKIVTLLWRFCNLCNFIIFLLSFNYLVTLLWHFCDTFVKISGPQFNKSTKILIFKTNFQLQYFSDKGFNAAGPANTVSFRQGANVEFEGPSFVNTAGSGGEGWKRGHWCANSSSSTYCLCLSRSSLRWRTRM